MKSRQTVECFSRTLKPWVGVHQKDVDAPGAKVGYCFLAVSRRESTEAVILERIAESLADHGVLIDYQNVLLVSHLVQFHLKFLLSDLILRKRSCCY